LETDDTGTTVARYTAGLEMDNWIAMQRDGITYTYHRDGMGSITGLTDPTQNVVATYQYDVFGELSGQTGNVANPYRFTGRAYEPLSGLYYYRARFYDPLTGRFVSRDPVAGFPLFPVTHNGYVYAFNNPLAYVDPTGEFGFFTAVAIIAVGYLVGQLFIQAAANTYEACQVH
ncbi:MAG: RHS repeat-associated core domain-containing protein, partial [Anaerolineae bacterium]